MNHEDLNDKTRWAVKPYSWSRATVLASELGIPLVAAIVLCARGLHDAQTAREFLDGGASVPDPFLFADMQGAVDILTSALERGQHIVVHGDYDADGITATAVLVLGLRDLGAQVDWYLPSRFEEGYGLSRQAVESIASGGADVLVTVDCGVNYPEEVALAKERGMKVVVVDHHEPGPVLPDCELIHRARGEYPEGGLCGVGLALKLLHGMHIQIRRAARERVPIELEMLLDLVAIGTIADLVELRGENREYVRRGLKLLNGGQRLGLRVLSEVAGCQGSIDSGAVAFRLAPRLNAAGRLADPTSPLKLILSENEGEARSLAAELHEFNATRQELERQAFEQARDRVCALPELPPAIVLADERWHEGVVGIVASRLVERFHRPTVLLALRDGIAKGSGRSINGYDLFQGLTACSGMLTVYGGHAQAAGLTLAEEAVDGLSACLCDHVRESLGEEELVPGYVADAVLTSADLSVDSAQALESLEPFGSGNPRPRLLIVDALARDAQRTRNGLHLRCGLEVGGVVVPAIGFGMGGHAEVIGEGPTRMVVGGQLRTDEWQGRIRLQVVLERVGTAQNVPLDGERADGGGRAGLWAGDGTGCSGGGGRPKSARSSGGEGNAAVRWPKSARDLRGRPDVMTSLLQVLASGEPAMVLTGSIELTDGDFRGAIPAGLLSGGIMRAPTETGGRCGLDGRSEGLWMVEWDLLDALAEKDAKSRVHVVASMPPYRREHLERIAQAADGGALVHLVYGERERACMLARLRYLVHPRFAMVCVYRAIQTDPEDDKELLELASGLAWEEARICLRPVDLERGLAILRELGLDRETTGEAKLEAGRSSLYREAEAQYEECVRLCQSV